MGITVQNTLKIFLEIEKTGNSVTWVKSFQTKYKDYPKYARYLVPRMPCF